MRLSGCGVNPTKRAHALQAHHNLLAQMATILLTASDGSRPTIPSVQAAPHQAQAAVQAANALDTVGSPSSDTIDLVSGPPPPVASSTPPLPLPSQQGAALKPAKRGSKQTGAGSLNDSKEDINMLLEFVSAVEPLGANHWTIVADRYATWAVENDRSPRDHDSIKNKFDKLANAKKKTGDPSCPSPVRKAKNVARAIQNKCAARVLGDTDEEVEEDSLAGGGHWETEDAESVQVIGARQKKRKVGATGTTATTTPLSHKSTSTEKQFLGQFEKMTDHMGSISRSLFDGAGKAGDAMSRQDIKKAVKEEVRESLLPTNALLWEMSSMIKNLSQDRNKVTSTAPIDEGKEK